jgi:hypothetical protein
VPFRPDRLERDEKRRVVEAYAQAAIDIGANYALTLTPDIHPVAGEDLKALINGIATDVFRELSRELAARNGEHLSGREAKRRPTLDFLGLYEFQDKRGFRYPHAHLAIKLDEDRDQPLWASMFFRERFGWKEADDNTGAPTSTRHPPTGKLVTNRRLGPDAHAYLTPITGMRGWMRYIAKHADAASELILPDQFVRPRGGHVVAA